MQKMQIGAEHVTKDEKHTEDNQLKRAIIEIQSILKSMSFDLQFDLAQEEKYKPLLQKIQNK